MDTCLSPPVVIRRRFTRVASTAAVHCSNLIQFSLLFQGNAKLMKESNSKDIVLVGLPHFWEESSLQWRG